MERELSVYIDLKGQIVLVGRLWVKERLGKESVTFEYDAGWLRHAQKFSLGPSLPLTSGKHHSDKGLFGAFSDPAPDRWGQKLMRRFELESAQTEGRAPRTLLGSDFLAGVDDEIRLGALRFKRPGDDQFLAHTGRPVPPLLELRELLSATDRIEKGKARKKDIQLVLAPGGSLGGARPKATIRDRDKLHVAKFPSPTDQWPVIPWEAVVLDLAAKACVSVSPHRVVRIGTKMVLLTERFDREAGDIRLPYMSAMTALGAGDHEDRSYLEILEVLRRDGAYPAEDARQLWRRMAFNVLVSNTDDHLRNHGFLWAGQGWRLSPAFDMNPAPPIVGARVHALALNEVDHTSSIDTVMSVAEDYFGLTASEAMRIAGEVAAAVSTWRVAAGSQKLSAAEITFMAGAFDHDDLRHAIALGAKAPRILTLPGTKKRAQGGAPAPAKGAAGTPAKQPAAKQPPAKRPAAKKSAPKNGTSARRR